MDNRPCYVVLGATGGIGSELCRRLAAGRANIVAAGRDVEKLTELAATSGIKPFTLDATDIEQVVACLADAQQTFGRPEKGTSYFVNLGIPGGFRGHHT